MKRFFENLFGRKQEPPQIKKRPAPAREEFELYKKGDVIGGKYLVHGTLGKGGFGVVYLVSDRETRHVRALKTFRDEFLADPNARETFQKEALVWVRLGEHPFILAARWVEIFSGRLFVAMDFVEPDADGRVTLNDHLRSGRPFVLERAVEWAIQFCSGMEHANAHGVICHRDIKPANIMISQGVLKISDFGLAAAAEEVWKRIAGKGNSLVTGNEETGFGFSVIGKNGQMRCGTPGYMSPEVYRGERADVQSDIYSFGLVLWQMAVGSVSPPFVGKYRGDDEAYMREAYERQMSGRFPPVAPPLGLIVERCLNATPSKRYSSFGEVRRALEPILHKQTGETFSQPTGEETVAYWNDRGGSLGALGKFAEAIGCFDKALAIDPKDAMAWSNKGAVLVQLERWEEAAACFDKALSNDPRLALAWHNKASVLIELGRGDEAMACFNKALAIDPRYVSAWNNKGRLFANAGRHEEAVACFDKSLAIDSQYADAWVNKGGSLRALGKNSEVLVCFDKAIAIDPRDAMAWNNKGAFLASIGRREEAIDCYERALAIEPKHVMSWFNKSISEDTIGRAAMAAKSYRKFIEFAPAQYAQQIANAKARIRELEKR
jgi:serine/threonine protein kinase/Tfp pilus assembly protein PilF